MLAHRVERSQIRFFGCVFFFLLTFRFSDGFFFLTFVFLEGGSQSSSVPGGELHARVSGDELLEFSV